ncbi:hypothetical protein GGD88_002274 [Roseospira goensis]|uniref:Uncharacterized protein n=1 Tax=Roseospira goensis TaxID=391922 RepID=A0A7W6S1P2_9PROT|nr:hypothetical protein [Roseospira goensis]
MADVPGVASGSPSPTSSMQTGAVRAAAIGEHGGRASGGGSGPSSRASGADPHTPPVIRFEGRDLDPFAPRGTYLDIVV